MPMDDFQIDRIRQDVTESLNYRQNYRRQLSMNDPFIFEGYTLYLQFQMKHSGYLNPSEGNRNWMSRHFKSMERHLQISMEVWVDSNNKNAVRYSITLAPRCFRWRVMSLSGSKDRCVAADTYSFSNLVYCKRHYWGSTISV